ncbi:hypothetical protein HDU97_002483 [Phlyctochytrium planicorne]|nr:hypothetical protein HDU97_002483 [Phlyctochytrium planicorne]
MSDLIPSADFDFWKFLRQPVSIAPFARPGSSPTFATSTGDPVCSGDALACNANNSYIPSHYTPESNSSFVEMVHMYPDYTYAFYPRLIDGLKLNMTIKYMGEAYDDYLADSIAKKLPLIAYYWKPTVFTSVYNLTRIMFPDDVHGKFPSFQDNRSYPVNFDIPTDIILKSVSNKFASDFDEIVNLIVKLKITDEQIEGILRDFATDGSYPKVVCNWLKANTDLVRSWIPSPPRAFVPCLPDQVRRVVNGLSTCLTNAPYRPNNSLRMAFVALVAVCSAACLGLTVAMVVYIKKKIFKAASPRFLALIVAGANISFVSIWVFSKTPISDSSCIAFAWLKYLGFAVVFGSLIVKTYRIHIIFKAEGGKQNLSDGILFAYFVVIVTIWLAILIIWTVIPSQKPFVDVIESYKFEESGKSVSALERTPFCNFTSYNYVGLAAMVITLAVGVFLTYSVRNTPGAFNESKWMAFAIYNHVVIGIALNAISNFAVKDPGDQAVDTFQPSSRSHSIDTPSSIGRRSTKVMSPSAKQTIRSQNMAPDQTQL